jgi:hypothetical protein
MRENRPIELVRTELAGEDKQSKYAAAMLLARWKDYESSDKIQSLLLPHLADDGKWKHHALPAYEALVWYGRENTLELLDEFYPTDWQAAALIVCVAAFHGVTTAFVTDVHRKEWLAQIEKFESGEFASRFVRNCDAKIAAAALYLDSGAPSFLSRVRIPHYLKRMLDAGGSVTPLTERANWMMSWFPMLDPSRERVSMVLVMGEAN